MPVVDYLPIGFVQSISVIGTYSDGSTKNLTHNPYVKLVSSSPEVLEVYIDTISGKPFAKAVSAGVAIINITGFGLESKVFVKVMDSSPLELQVKPTSISIPVGLSQQLTANLIMPDGSIINVTDNLSLVWKVDDINIASIRSSESSGNGFVTGLNIGQVNITVTGFGFTTTIEINITDAIPIKLELMPSITSIAKGLRRNLAATALFSDNSSIDVTNNTELVWNTSDSAIATITTNQLSGNGTVYGVEIGDDIDVTASFRGIRGIAKLNVTNPIVDVPSVGTFVHQNMVLRNWISANIYCQNLIFNGEIGWRLPNFNEMNSLYELYPSGLISTIVGWPYDGPFDYFWTSSVDASGNTYYYRLRRGSGYFTNSGSTFPVACIR
ncbi:Ig-like domain-containing protein, partial [Vibrio cholerae]|uniref:Ig-like domain-containing protein n=1 Tax=Vibrio cholerae TaxID=666 RepID=UPI00308094A7